MGTESSSERESSGPVQPSASGPLTLTDPDGSVTRVAPWSSWTREQMRAPGGEPLLVTRIDQGQLWFAAGRRRSPWRHEVVAGPATITTSQGRFHVTAEEDGGATVAGLAGRTRVHARLSEPVVVGPNQVASVSADGTTVVIADAASDSPGERAIASATLAVAAAHDPELPVTDDGPIDEDEATPPADPPAVAPSDGGGSSAGADEPDRPTEGTGGDDTEATGAATDGNEVSEPDEARARMIPWLPELVAVAAILGVLIAATIIFGRGSGNSDVVVAPPTSVDTTLAISTTAAPTTAAPTTAVSTTAVSTTAVSTTVVPTTVVPTTVVPTTVAPTTVAPTTVAPTTVAPTTVAPTTVAPTTAAPTTPSALVAPATATGQLTSCRRTADGVMATVTVSHQSGGVGRFAVEVGLVDDSGIFAQAVNQSGEVPPGGSVPVDVLVPVAGPAGGFCELLAVRAA